MNPGNSDKEVVLSLVSHTNVGKTALARTLLRRDIGEVADSAHVTIVPEAHPLIAAGERSAKLWDTPGFGSNLAKLAKRLRSSENPVGWILHQVWDRATDRSLWCSQEAIRNIQAEADVVLYLVDASQSPEETGYIDLEIEVIEWIGKPVLVYLNQTGAPEAARDRENEALWRARLAKHAVVKRVSTLDAFTRCWTQEHQILAQAAEVLSGEKRRSAVLLAEAWISRQLDVFGEAVSTIAALVSFALADTEALPERSVLEKARLLLGKRGRDRDLERIQSAMYARLSAKTSETVNRLIALHGLSGATARELANASREALAVRRDVDEPLMAVLGGVGAGLVGGLAADLASGGMSLGGGAIVGMLAGGATTYALAKGYNLAQTGKNRVRWTEAHFFDQVQSILLLYLAVAHFGRGRGTWRDPLNNPARWQEIVGEEVMAKKGDWSRLWKEAEKSAFVPTQKIASIVRPALEKILARLYPDSDAFFRRP